ncbi:MAG: AMP-binding enzyme, partial [Acidimicrobiia bacterium]
MVWRDGDGFFHYAGRSDDALKVGGKWLLPAEVEDCLVTHPGVSAAAVVGMLGNDGLPRPVAFVVPASVDSVGSAAGQDLEVSIQDHCLARLDAYKHPRR